MTDDETGWSPTDTAVREKFQGLLVPISVRIQLQFNLQVTGREITFLNVGCKNEKCEFEFRVLKCSSFIDCEINKFLQIIEDIPN